MSDDRAPPHCPRCGGDAKWHEKHSTTYTYGCDDCGFGDPSGDTMYSPQGWRQVVRAELARQALEMRAHSAATQNMAHGCSLFTLSETVLMVTNDYEWLGNNPIRLPGEANDA